MQNNDNNRCFIVFQNPATQKCIKTENYKSIYHKFKLKAILASQIIIFFVFKSFNSITFKIIYVQPISLFILIFMFSVNAIAQDVDYRSLPQIQTSATYSEEVAADIITLSITLSESDSKGKISIETLEKNMEKVLKANDIDLKKQLTLEDLSSSFKNYFLRKNDVQKTKDYKLEVYDALTASKILKELEDEDISNVSLLNTRYSKLEELKIELKGKAVEKAKKQAEEMLKYVDQELGPVIFISDLNTNIYQFNKNQLYELNQFRTSGLQNEHIQRNQYLDVEFDKIKVEVNIMVYFKLN